MFITSSVRLLPVGLRQSRVFDSVCVCVCTQVVTWAVLCMHYLANEVIPSSGADRKLTTQLSELEVMRSRRPTPSTGNEAETWQELSEQFLDLSDGLAKEMVDRADTSLALRESLLQARQGTQTDGSRAVQPAKEEAMEESSGEEEMEDESEESGPVISSDDVPRPSSKRPSQVDYHRWVQDLAGTGAGGQRKRKRHLSPQEAAGQGVEALELRSPGEMDVEKMETSEEAETDSGLDQGAYLAMMRKRQYVSPNMQLTLRLSPQYHWSLFWKKKKRKKETHHRYERENLKDQLSFERGSLQILTFWTVNISKNLGIISQVCRVFVKVMHFEWWVGG